MPRWSALTTVLSSREKLFLSSERVARIATINPRTKIPHVVPVSFAFDGDSIFSTIGTKTARFRNIESGSSVALEIDKKVEENDQVKVRNGMLVVGKHEILSYNKDKEKFMHAWKLLIEKYPYYIRWANADLSPKDPDEILLVVHPTKGR